MQKLRGTMTIRGPNAYLVINREEIRQTETTDYGLKIWFAGEEHPYQYNFGDQSVAILVYSDLLDSADEIAWEQLEDDEPWRRNGAVISFEAP